MDEQQKERQSNRDFELESDPIAKDEKFDRLLETTREKVKRQGERTTFTKIYYPTRITTKEQYECFPEKVKGC